MVLLGIDPGYRNLGYCLVRTNNGTSHAEILQKGTLSLKTAKDWTIGLPKLVGQLVDKIQTQPKIVAIEMISWYGKRKGVLALAHLAGAVAGPFVATGSVIKYFPASMVKQATLDYPAPKNFNEHEADALSLCRLALAQEDDRETKLDGKAKTAKRRS